MYFLYLAIYVFSSTNVYLIQLGKIYITFNNQFILCTNISVKFVIPRGKLVLYSLLFMFIACDIEAKRSNSTKTFSMCNVLHGHTSPFYVI